MSAGGLQAAGPGWPAAGSVRGVAWRGRDRMAGIAEAYRTFARHEARGRSPAYQALAEAVAGDAAVLRFLGALPPEKRQPNLLFAAARYLLGTPADITRLRDLVRRDGPGLSGVMLARRTQTDAGPLRHAAAGPGPAAAAAGADEAGPAPGSPCSWTATPTITPGTGSPARIRWPLPCGARRAGRCRSRRSPP